MGLDPPTLQTLSPLLRHLAENQAPRILLSLRPQDPLPEWITHLVRLGPELRVSYQGLKEGDRAVRKKQAYGMKTPLRFSREGLPLHGETLPSPGEPIIEMHHVVVKYGDKAVLGNWQEGIDGQVCHGLQWTVRRGERWGVFGPNGTVLITPLQLPTIIHS